jgi:hypothetical protein
VEWDERPLWRPAEQKLLARELPKEGRTQRWQMDVVDMSRSRGKIDRMQEGILLPAGPMVVAVAGHGRSDEEVEEGGLPCEAVACRKRSVRTRGEVGNPLGVHILDVQGAGSMVHSEGEEAGCASD